MDWEPPYKGKPDAWILDRIDEALGVGDDHSVGLYITELQERGVYPWKTVAGNPNTVEQMVQCYGARWCFWEGEWNECPHCKADLRDHTGGPPFKRELSFYNRERDCTTCYICPDCKTRLDLGPTLLEHILETP